MIQKIAKRYFAIVYPHGVMVTAIEFWEVNNRKCLNSRWKNIAKLEIFCKYRMDHARIFKHAIGDSFTILFIQSCICKYNCSDFIQFEINLVVLNDKLYNDFHKLIDHKV